jgi:hypothetical protein
LLACKRLALNLQKYDDKDNILDSRFSILDTGYWILDMGCGIPDAGRSVAEIPYHQLQGDDREYWIWGVDTRYRMPHMGY